MQAYPWLKPLYSAEQLREIDRWAIEERGVPSLELMERAGEGLARVAAEIVPSGQIAIVCGKGNNAGDGFVAARHLRSWGHDVAVLLTCDPTEFTGDALKNFERLEGNARPFTTTELGDASGVVDALLGTGTSGEPRGATGATIAAINASGLPVVAADIPSGVDASTGEAGELAVKAAVTTTFHAPKLGLYVTPGKYCTGRVEVIEIGIPSDAETGATVGLIDPTVLELLPRRTASTTKFSAGVVTVVGGSTGLTGAPCLAAEGAQRSGAGYVTVAVPASLDIVFEQQLLEVMSKPLPDSGGSLTPAAVEPALATLERSNALILGPGLGRGDGVTEFARELARRSELPLVLDADGLNAHAGGLADLAGRSSPTVLTPHAGELARLLGVDSQEVSARRLHCVRLAAQRADAVVVLKGDDTLVATPDGFVAVSPGDCPALATAGTGDVLAGVIGALLAKGLDPFTAACAGVYLHLCAGQLAAVEKGEAVIARDVIASLPQALAE